MSVGWTRSSYTVIPSCSTAATLTASGRSTRPRTTNSRKACIAEPVSNSGRSWRSGRSARGCRGSSGGLANKAGNRVGRLRALVEPILGPFVIQDKIVPLLQGLIGADFFDELAVARAAIVRHHNAEHGGVLRPDSFHAYSHCHKLLLVRSGRFPIHPGHPASFSDAGSKRGVSLFMLLGLGKPCFWRQPE